MNSNGVITAPVSIQDVLLVVPAYLLRIVAGSVETKRSGDLGVLTSTENNDLLVISGTTFTVYRPQNINLESKFKPTSKVGVNIFDDWKGLGLDINQNDYYSGADYAGIYKPYMTYTGTLSPGTPTMLNNFSVDNTFKNSLWQLSLARRRRESNNTTTCTYRLADFNNYTHTNFLRTDTPSNNLLTVSSSAYYTGESNISISAQFTFGLLTQYSGNAASLGMIDIFKADAPPAYYGLLAVNSVSSKASIIYISTKSIGDTNSGTDREDTGLSYVTNISIPNGSYISTDKSDSSKIFPEDEITIIPIIARQIVENGPWYFMNLNYKGVNGQTTYQIPKAKPNYSPLYFLWAKIKLGISKDSNGIITFSIYNNTDYISFKPNSVHSGTTSGDITIADGGKLMIGPVDGNSISIYELQYGLMGSGNTDMRNLHVGSLNEITQTSAIINNYQASRFPLLKVKPYTGISSFKVSVTFSYWRPTSIGNGLYELHKYYCTATTEEINIGSITSSISQTDWITFVQVDTGQSQGSQSSNITYNFHSNKITVQFSSRVGESYIYDLPILSNKVDSSNNNEQTSLNFTAPTNNYFVIQSIPYWENNVESTQYKRLLIVPKFNLPTSGVSWSGTIKLNESNKTFQLTITWTPTS